jgi:intracellular multiplication protein IcmD
VKLIKKCKKGLAPLFVGLLPAGAFATSYITLGAMASSITSNFQSVSKLITAASYVGGLGFMISSIMKFKQHKDNPQQTPIGQPVGLLFIAAALLFLPSVLGLAGMTIFGGGSTASPSGTVFST